MSNEVTISSRTNAKLERVLTEIQSKLRREALQASVDEKTMIEFMGYKNYRSAERARNDGRIPKDSYITLTNGKRRYFLDKLIKQTS